MSIVIWTRLEALEERVAALEASLVVKNAEPLPPVALAQSNAMRKAEGERTRDEIRHIVISHPGPKPLSAGAVRRELLTELAVGLSRSKPYSGICAQYAMRPASQVRDPDANLK